MASIDLVDNFVYLWQITLTFRIKRMAGGDWMRGVKINIWFIAIAVVVSNLTWWAVGKTGQNPNPQQIAATYKGQASLTGAQNLHTAWLDDRQRNMDLVEQGSIALQVARETVAGTNITIPRDAAICLEARRQIDYELMVAMAPGQEFGRQLGQWHGKARAVGLFCDYALSVGGKR